MKDRPPTLSKRWRMMALAAIMILMTIAFLPAQQANAAAACSITYTNQNDWSSLATIKEWIL